MPLPPLTDPFYWTQEPWGPALRCRALEDVAGAHVFTTRQLPLSSLEDWRRAAATVGAREIVTAVQVHGRDVFVVREGSAPVAERPEADVLLSNDPSVAVGVRAADCVPILIASERTGGVAAVHAGWRGTVAAAARAAVEALCSELRVQPADLVAAIGPAIGPCCYDVRSDVVDAFAAAGYDRQLIERWIVAPRWRGEPEAREMRLDLPGANRDLLIMAGVREDRIHVAGLCTAHNLDVLTSFRIEKDRAGRIAGIIRARRP